MKKCNHQFLPGNSTNMVINTNLTNKNIPLKNINLSMKNLNRLLLMPLMVLVVLFGSGNVWGQSALDIKQRVPKRWTDVAHLDGDGIQNPKPKLIKAQQTYDWQENWDRQQNDP